MKGRRGQLPVCPHCTREIKESARKCPHCKSFLDPRLAAERQAEEPVAVTAGEATEQVSAGGLIVRSVIELLFAFGTLVIGPICGVLTVIFAGWEVWKCAEWNGEYRKAFNRNSTGAVIAMVLSGLAAVLAALFTWMVLQGEPI